MEKKNSTPLNYKEIDKTSQASQTKVIPEIDHVVYPNYPQGDNETILKNNLEANVRYLVAFFKDKPIAYTSFRINEQKKQIETLRTIVVKEFRKTKVATKLTARIIGIAREKGFKIKRIDQNEIMKNLAQKMIDKPRRRYGKNKKIPEKKLPERIRIRKLAGKDYYNVFIVPRKRTLRRI